MRYVLIIPLILLLTGCVAIREVILPDGTVYAVKARTDDMISFKNGSIEITIDGRGRPGIIEQALGVMFMNLPDVNVGTD